MSILRFNQSRVSGTERPGGSVRTGVWGTLVPHDMNGAELWIERTARTAGSEMRYRLRAEGHCRDQEDAGRGISRAVIRAGGRRQRVRNDLLLSRGASRIVTARRRAIGVRRRAPFRIARWRGGRGAVTTPAYGPLRWARRCESWRHQCGTRCLGRRARANPGTGRPHQGQHDEQAQEHVETFTAVHHERNRTRFCVSTPGWCFGTLNSVSLRTRAASTDDSRIVRSRSHKDRTFQFDNTGNSGGAFAPPDTTATRNWHTGNRGSHLNYSTTAVTGDRSMTDTQWHVSTNPSDMLTAIRNRASARKLRISPASASACSSARPGYGTSARASRLGCGGRIERVHHVRARMADR